MISTKIPIMEKRFTIEHNKKAYRCPVCKNRKSFIVVAEQCDIQYDLWIKCGKCHYDPSVVSQIKLSDPFGVPHSGRHLQQLIERCWNNGIRFTQRLAEAIELIYNLHEVITNKGLKSVMIKMINEYVERFPHDQQSQIHPRQVQSHSILKR